MAINADFQKRVSVHYGEQEWQASPMPGVDRKMLDRIGDEVARATTIVRYAPGSHFSSHTHSGGEEFLVLEGVFQDEHGSYPVGTYVRNPIGSTHTPRSDDGCIIFVKLWQFDEEDTRQFSEAFDFTKKEQTLHQFDGEQVRFVSLQPGEEISGIVEHGMEVLVLDGSIAESDEDFTLFSWLRLPHEYTFTIRAGADSAKLWIKSGHLATIDTPNQ